MKENRIVHGLIYTRTGKDGKIIEDLFYSRSMNPDNWKLEDVPTFMWDCMFSMDFMPEVRMGGFERAGLGEPIAIVGIKWGEEEKRFQKPFLFKIAKDFGSFIEHL